MRQFSDLTAAEIRQAIEELMPQYGRVRAGTLLVPVAGMLGVQCPADHADRNQLKPAMARALDALAAEGKLRKVGPGDRLPADQFRVLTSERAFWCTHERWALMEAAAARHTAEAQAKRERLAEISERAAVLGIRIPDPAQPSARSLERLLSLAEGNLPDEKREAAPDECPDCGSDDYSTEPGPDGLPDDAGGLRSCRDCEQEWLRAAP